LLANICRNYNNNTEDTKGHKKQRISISKPSIAASAFLISKFHLEFRNREAAKVSSSLRCMMHRLHLKA